MTIYIKRNTNKATNQFLHRNPFVRCQVNEQISGQHSMVDFLLALDLRKRYFN